MRFRWVIGVCAVAIGAIGVMQPVSAGEKEKGEGAGEQDFQKMMEMMKKMGEPGPYHDHLNVFEGNWKATVKHWRGPGEPEVSEATIKYEWILGGRFLRETVKGAFEGEPFEGFGLIGYDNAKKQYCTVWCDNMSTGIYTSHGTCDDSGKVFTYYSTHTNPVTGEDEKGRSVAKVINDNTFVSTMYGIDEDGNQQNRLEITCNRM
jgi:hypothetical protein